METSLDNAVRSFAKFLNASWEIVIPLLENRSYTVNESSISDWIQSNWEILVERKVLEVNEYLDVYGVGADFNGSSSRITDPDALPSFSVKVWSRPTGSEVLDILNDEEISINNGDFVEFVSFQDDFYQREPKFDYVLLEDESGRERVVLLSDVEFKLEEIEYH
ncbi:MAG: hypothetical protein Salg2KO_16680 [Salibacteraceae bacterium]